MLIFHHLTSKLTASSVVIAFRFFLFWPMLIFLTLASNSEEDSNLLLGSTLVLYTSIVIITYGQIYDRRKNKSIAG